MAVIKNNQLNKEVSAVTGISQDNVKFIMDRYFHYAIPAMMNGYPITARNELRIRLASIIYTNIPLKLRRLFTYSSKIFGFTFLPICDHRNLTDAGYNYKPNKKILGRIAEFTDTDAIYTLAKR